MKEKIKIKSAGFRVNKTVAAIAGGIALALAILAFSNYVTTPTRNNPYFRYGTEGNPNGLIHVMDEERVEVPFEFDIGKGTAEVGLAFSGEHKLMPGFVMIDAVAAVINGKAASRVIIQFEAKPPLKAGTHNLTVVATDRATGKIVRKGTIQFTYNMYEVLGKCSC